MPEYVAYSAKKFNAAIFLCFLCSRICIFREKMLKVEEFNPLASEESEVSQTGLHTLCCISV